jgi:DTW domain-containing protein YfiP
LCLCGEVPTIATRTRIVIVRHHRELHRSSNTGRLAALALANSALVDLDDAGRAALPPLEDAWLLFPEGPEPTAGRPPPRQLVVLDATWSQARRMYRKIPGLLGLPTLRLTGAPTPAARLRASPAPGQVSTIEAIAHALRQLEGEVAAAPLEALFATAVARAAAAGRQPLAGP